MKNPMIGARRLKSVTIIELLVGLSLGVLLLGIMVYVWTTSQRIVTETTDRLVVYQRLRQVIDQIERDVANIVRTTDMEFFDDKPDGAGNGHYDLASGSAAEELPLLRESDSFHLDTDSQSPVDANLADGPNRNLNSVPYFFAPLLYRPTSYPPVPNYDIGADVTAHRRDELYFRTFAQINGESRPALVHYRLRVSQGKEERPTLQRRVSYVDYTTPSPTPQTRTDDLAEGVTDLEFAMFYKESRIFDRGQFLDAKQARSVDDQGNALIPGLDQQYNSTAVSMVYAGEAIIENTLQNGVWMRPLNDKIQFGAVRPGDRFYLYDAEDDDNGGGSVPLSDLFGQRYVTVEQIIALQDTNAALGAQSSKIFVKFVEPIEFAVLQDALGSEVTNTVTEFGDPDLRRTIYSTFQVKFRVGFLPGAFRMRMKFRDFRKRRLIPFERVIRVLNS